MTVEQGGSAAGSSEKVSETLPEASAPGTMRRFGALVRSALLPTGVFVVILLGWELWVRLRDVPGYILPAPTQIVRKIVTAWSSPLALDTRITVFESLIGFVGGSILGFILAVLLTYSTALERSLYPLILAVHATPKIAIAPLFVLWMGFGLLPKIVVTLLVVFFPVVITTAQGLSSVDSSLLDLMKSVRASQWQVFRKVRLPHSLPYFVSGLKIGITLAVIGAVVAEWAGASEGLGYRILFAKSQLDTLMVFAAITILVLVSVIVFILVSVLGNLLTPWEEDSKPMAGGM